MKIVFLTGNKNKFEEAQQMIPNLEQSNVDLTEIQSIDPKEVITHKLNEGRKVIKDNFIVEDTSLYLECLNGLPGPLIKWFLKTIGNEGLAKIADSFGNNKAEAKVVIGLAKEDGSNEFFEGVVKGKIVKPRGETNFGWDPIFQSDEYDKTYAEMTRDEKNKISPRKIAFQKLADFILKP
jgi:non-canonical purine NTP pyrophosphatase (RdgB/HAM1 family)